MNIFFTAFSSLLLAASTPNEALTYAQKAKLHDLQHIHMIFNTRYAPKEWKEEHIGWDLEAEYAKACEKVLYNPGMSPQEFFQVVQAFTNSAQDYHVSCEFQATENASLPFSVKSANGRYFIQAFDEERMDLQLFYLQIGDELISIDGRPVDEIAKEIILKTGLGFVDADQAFTDLYLTHRTILHGAKIPQGPVDLQFADRETGESKSYQMIWQHEPEYFTFHRNVELKSRSSLLDVEISVPDTLKALRTADRQKLLGYKDSKLPPLGEIIWENDPEDFFQAYIFKTEEGLPVGFLRIPDYYPMEGKKGPLEELADIITQFEAFSSLLIIDQTDNPGGALNFLYEVCSFFANKPLKAPRHKMQLTPELIASSKMELQSMVFIDTVQQAKAYLKPINEYLASKRSLQTIHMLRQFFEFLMAEWDKGKELSDSIYLVGTDSINPHPDVVYTKPILVLINELSLSCGDLFPAIMQDNGRALIIGNRSAGAGGRVEKHYFLSNSGIQSLRHTTSLVERPDTKKMIENLGVVPDLQYKVSEYDLQNHYEGYKQALLEFLQVITTQAFSGG